MSTFKLKASLFLKLIQTEVQALTHFKHARGSENALVNNLKEDGYAVIPNFYSAEKCDLIRETIDHIIDSYPEILWIDDEKSDYRIFGAERASSLIQEYFENSKLLAIGEELLGVPLINHMTLAARLQFKSDNAGSGGGWHRDSPFENQFKSILYLSDVSDSNGPYQYVKNSHKFSHQFKTLGYGKNLMRFTNDEVEEVVRKHNWGVTTFEAKKGSLILTNTRGLHRGKPIDQDIRYALTNYYTPKFQAEKFASYFEEIIKEPNKPFEIE